MFFVFYILWFVYVICIQVYFLLFYQKDQIQKKRAKIRIIVENIVGHNTLIIYADLVDLLSSVNSHWFSSTT